MSEKTRRESKFLRRSFATNAATTRTTARSAANILPPLSERVYRFDVSRTKWRKTARPPRPFPAMSGDIVTALWSLSPGRESRLVIRRSYCTGSWGFQGWSDCVLLPGQNKAEEFATLTHEVAHELLEHASRHAETTKTVREAEAEGVSFIVYSAIGLETGSASSRLPFCSIAGTPKL